MRSISFRMVGQITESLVFQQGNDLSSLELKKAMTKWMSLCGNRKTTATVAILKKVKEKEKEKFMRPRKWCRSIPCRSLAEYGL